MGGRSDGARGTGTIQRVLRLLGRMLSQLPLPRPCSVKVRSSRTAAHISAAAVECSRSQLCRGPRSDTMWFLSLFSVDWLVTNAPKSAVRFVCVQDGWAPVCFSPQVAGFSLPYGGLRLSFVVMASAVQPAGIGSVPG